MTIFWHQHLHTKLLLLLAVCVIAPFTNAGQKQSLDSITAIAASTSKENARLQGYKNVTVEIRTLDNRLRLPQCSQPLSTFSPRASRVLGTISIGVRCDGTKPWTIYVRTNVSAQQAVPVLTSPLPRHALITKDDLRLINQPLRSMPDGVVYDTAKIIGMELTRPLNAGVPIKASQLRAPKVVARGQHVTLITSLSGLEVRMQGKALQNAATGERVIVTNLNSGKQIEGVAHSDGTVHVP